MKALLLIGLMLLMTACAAIDATTSSARVPVQFALMKTMQENPEITPDIVMRETAHFRQIVNADPDVDVKALLADAVIRYGIDNIAPESQLYLRLLFYNIEQAVTQVRPDSPPSERQVRLLTLLGWIDQAARLYR
ncbi:hypothetical protein [Methylophaga sp. OBS4]|uniref:hypothetical protein n=1 Tax=Methylophaga sp. OBS4 TaxID=2991935 RepID=UPI0022545E05|nr:hypothetical protein [Methylophaga sp. OBS4]MCX4186783.1 hypothetical protein [Methylophaga sp. OBS4]